MRVRDPVCGMCIEWEEACAFQVVGDVVVYFCCRGCEERFREAPKAYLERRVPAHELEECPTRPIPVSSHGVPTAVRLEVVPRVGRLGLDEFEQRLQRAWPADESGKRACRVLERALLSRVLGWAESHRLDVRIAAEISVLRHHYDDPGVLGLHLAGLPEALASACREAGLPRQETRRLRSAMAEQVADARAWLDARPAHLYESSDPSER